MNGRKLVFDIESDGLLDSITRIWCIVVMDADTDEMFSFGPDQIYEALKLLDTADTLVAHNGIGFDLPALEKVVQWKPRAGVEIIDTLVLAWMCHSDQKDQDLDSKRPHIKKLNGSHSLESWGIRLGLHKGSYGDTEGAWNAFNSDMMEYCQRDVEINLRLLRHLERNIPPKGAIDLEMAVAVYAEECNRRGWKFDLDAADVLLQHLSSRQEELRGELSEIFPLSPEVMKTPAYYEISTNSRGIKRFPTKGEADKWRKSVGLRPKEVKIVPGPPKQRVRTFNPNSTKQIAEQLFKRYGWVSPELTDKGYELLDKKKGTYEELVMVYPSIKEEILETTNFPESPKLIEYMMVCRRISMLAKGDKSWLKQVGSDGRLRYRLNSIGTVTQRSSHCIEENQLVLTPEGKIPIKDIKPGQWVYSYSDDNEFRMNRVVDVIDKGEEEVYAYKWRTNMRGRMKGEILMTPSHKVRNPKGGYIRAGEMVKGQRLLHGCCTISSGRHLIHFSGGNRRQCTFIKEHVFGKKGRKWHIHHIDHNKLNDSIDNLKVMSDEEHTKYHANIAGPIRLDISPWRLLRWLAEAKGAVREIPMDFDTYKKYCEYYGIPLEKYRKRYTIGRSKLGRKYITKGMLIRAYREAKNSYQAGIILGMDQRYVEKRLECHDLILNHWFYGSEYVGRRRVYDLHVERDNNFICEEICVSNSTPNLSQVTGVGKPYGEECRSLFVASDGYVEVGIDLSGIEARLLAHFLYTYDRGKFGDLVLNGDFHQHNADNIGLPRSPTKNVFYGWAYGAGDVKIGRMVVSSSDDWREHYEDRLKHHLKSSIMNVASKKSYREVGKEIRTRLEQGIDGLPQLILDVKIASKRGYLSPLDGRRIPVRAEHSALNTLLQGSAAIVAKRWLSSSMDVVRKRKLDSHMLIFSHDEVQSDVRPDHVDQHIDIFMRGIKYTEKFYSIKIPLDGEAKVGSNWCETH